MRKKSGIAAAAAAAIIMSLSVSAAEEPFIDQYYRNEKTITAFVSGISSDDPEVKIAGISCGATNAGNVYSDSDKYETVFLIDSSGSMGCFSDEIESFLTECIDKKPDNEYYSIGLFASGNNPEYIADKENDQYALEKCLGNLKYDFKSTYIYDNLINAIDKLYSSDEAIYRRIVLFTDGNENSARGVTIDDVISKIGDSPVPVYTVTLQTKSKDNLESLKNIARIARISGGSDIRIIDGGDAVKPTETLFEDVKNIYCINIFPSNELLDGSVKAIEISDGNLSAVGDVRMPMADLNTVTETETTITETEISESATEIEEPEGRKNNLIFPIIAAAVIIVIIGAVVGIITIIKNKRKKAENTSGNVPPSDADNSETMIISGRSGQTEMLFENGQPAVNTVILRDCENSFRTFEIQLNYQGAVIGRSAEFSNIVIDYDKSISRKHCRIFLKGAGIYIEDLGSGNKTFVNGSEVVSECRLNNADEIKIGRTKLKVTIK